MSDENIYSVCITHDESLEIAWQSRYEEFKELLFASMETWSPY